MKEDVVVEQIDQLDKNAEGCSFRLNYRDHVFFHSGEMARKPKHGRVGDIAELPRASRYPHRSAGTLQIHATVSGLQSAPRNVNGAKIEIAKLDFDINSAADYGDAPLTTPDHLIDFTVFESFLLDGVA